MALVTITVSDPGLEKRSSEVAFLNQCLMTAIKEIGRGNGTVTAGTIVGMNSAGVPNSALGSWTYISSATKP